MKVVVQRSKNAKVTINGKITGQIDKGYVLLVGLTHDDTEEIVSKVAEKIVNLRIFEDENEKMNYDLKQVGGSILSISQFTLYAKLDGRRPSFSEAMKYNEAKNLYEIFNEKLRSYDIKVETGQFGEDMKVELLNDGPVTIIVDSNEL
jgi:D-tyrosyl-tRNA(Tyr) deacylase